MDRIIYEAVLGFSLEEALAIAPSVENETNGTLTWIKRISEKKFAASVGYDPQPVGSGPGFQEFKVGKYLVRLAVHQKEVLASCECMDFAVRGRNQKVGCKHIAAALDLQDKEVLRSLLRR
jgi:hypothetical protein